MSDRDEGPVPVGEILPRVLARIPGMGAYLRQLEQEKGMIVTDLDQWYEHGEEDAA